MAAVLGVALEVAATVAGTAGKQMVSCSARSHGLTAKMLKVSEEAGGLATTTLLGPMLDAGAYACATQAIIAPLAGLDIVWNMCTAPYTLGDRLTRRHVTGGILIFVGAACSASLGPHEEEAVTLEVLYKTFFSAHFILYSMAFVTGLFLAGFILQDKPAGIGDQARGVTLGLASGGIAGNMFFLSQLLGLFRDCMSTGDWSAWCDWLPALVAIGAILCSTGNIPLMTKGLQEYEAIFMVTLFEGSHILVACISGMVVLREMREQSVWQVILYWFSLGLMGTGLLFVQATAHGQPVPLQDSGVPALAGPATESFVEEPAPKKGGLHPVLWANGFCCVWSNSGRQVSDANKASSSGSSDWEDSAVDSEHKSPDNADSWL